MAEEIDQIKLMADKLNRLYSDCNKFIIDDNLERMINNSMYIVNIIGAISFDYKKLYLFFHNDDDELVLEDDAFFFAFCTNDEAYDMMGFLDDTEYRKYRKINCKKAFDVLNKFQSYIRDKKIEKSFLESHDLNDKLINLLDTN